MSNLSGCDSDSKFVQGDITCAPRRRLSRGDAVEGGPGNSTSDQYRHAYIMIQIISINEFYVYELDCVRPFGSK